jgi:hypothetical protein
MASLSAPVWVSGLSAVLVMAPFRHRVTAWGNAVGSREMATRLPGLAVVCIELLCVLVDIWLQPIKNGDHGFL